MYLSMRVLLASKPHIQTAPVDLHCNCEDHTNTYILRWSGLVLTVLESSTLIRSVETPYWSWCLTFSGHFICLLPLIPTNCQRVPKYLLLIAATLWCCQRSHIVLTWWCLRCSNGMFWFQQRGLKISWLHLSTSCRNISSSPTLSYLPCWTLRCCKSTIFITVACPCQWWKS